MDEPALIDMVDRPRLFSSNHQISLDLEDLHDQDRIDPLLRDAEEVGIHVEDEGIPLCAVIACISPLD